MAGKRALLAGTVAALGVAVLAIATAGHPSVRPRVLAADGLLVVEGGEFTYTFDLVWRKEALYAAGEEPGPREDVLGARPAEAARLRGVLLRRLGYGSLEELPPMGEADIRRLESLGYLGR